MASLAWRLLAGARLARKRRAKQAAEPSEGWSLNFTTPEHSAYAATIL